MRKLNLGIIGLGTVGSGVVNALSHQPVSIVKAAVSELNKPRNCIIDFPVTTDGFSVATDPQIDVVIECMGGIEPAFTWIKAALSTGKSVITANKALLAHHGIELTALAQKNNVQLKYEAAVGGAIPIIKTLTESLASNRIHNIRGILNGTSNFILTQMQQTGLSFEAALREAQQKGYAEADPAFDIEGTDVAHKITLLARLAFDPTFSFANVRYEGITHITQADIQNAVSQNCKIKLIAEAYRDDQGVHVTIRPTWLKNSDLLSQVDGVLNAVSIQSDLAGYSLLIGEGAGSKATASAILADLQVICENQ